MTTGESHLISSADVTGTSVYGADDGKVGSIDRVMIDKTSGKVAYAVMNFGGILGMGGDERPVPWNTLTYDTSLGGYRTSITQEQLGQAPAADSRWDTNRDWEERTHQTYGSSPYWL